MEPLSLANKYILSLVWPLIGGHDLQYYTRSRDLVDVRKSEKKVLVSRQKGEMLCGKAFIALPDTEVIGVFV